MAAVAVAGVALLVLGQPHHGDHPAPGLAGDAVEAGGSPASPADVALLLLLRGLWMRFAAALRWALLLLLA